MNTSSYLPSKKLTLIVGAILVIGGGVLLARYTARAKQNTPKDQIASLTVSDLIKKDKDGDGIPDWEESLWGTDPDKTDSNGDGVSDFEEINKKKSLLSEENTGSDSENTQADDFSRDLFTSIMSLRESGNLNDESIGGLAKNIADEAKKRAVIPDFIQEKSITTVEITPASNIRYLKKTMDTILKYEKQGTGTEYQILAKILENIDTQQEDTITIPDTDKLSLVGDAYQNLAKELATIPAPSKYVTIQSNIINSAYKTGMGIKTIASSSPGSIESIIGISQYKKYIGDFDSHIESIVSIFIQNGILK